jgi:hypothetical protein
VVNTENDSLYPSASVGPIVSALGPLGVDVTFHAIPRFTHNPMYMATERPVIAAWMEKTAREPAPKTVFWQGTAGAPHRVDWLDGVVLGDAGSEADIQDPNPAIPPGRVRIGVNIDPEFPGPGVKVTNVAEDSAAEAMALQSGDVIVGLDDVDVGGIQDLRRVLGRKSHGDAFRLHLLRGEERIQAAGQFPEARPRPVFRRTEPWGRLAATVAENVFDVEARGIRRFDLYLSADLVDLLQPVKVRVDGRVLHDAVVEPDLEFLLHRAAADGDRSAVYLARLRVEVPASAGDGEG